MCGFLLCALIQSGEPLKTSGVHRLLFSRLSEWAGGHQFETEILDYMDLSTKAAVLVLGSNIVIIKINVNYLTIVCL